MNILVIRKWNNITADIEKVLVVWIDQIHQNIPFKPKPNWEQRTNINSTKAKRGEETAEEKLEASKGLFVRFKERNHFHSIKMQAAYAEEVEAIISYPEKPS